MASRLYKTGFGATDTPGDAVQLKAAASVNNYDCMEVDAANYPVPSGKTLYITKILIGGATNATTILFYYGDTAVDDAVGAPTNSVVKTALLFCPTANTTYEFDVFIPIPANKYPHIKAGTGTGYVTAFGLVI